jgi:RNA polymerase II subunit A small phosphatase-like protein
MMQNRKLLVLDLDETLIHTTYSPIINGELKAHRGLLYLYERPHLRDFLDSFSREYNLAIWSASKAEYVKWVIKSTVLKEYKFDFIKTRKHCKRIYGKSGFLEYQKDLTPHLLLYEKVIFLDDIPKMVVPIECCMKVPDFKGDIRDCFLINVLL